MNIHHFEMDTNDCDMVASDLQAGKTAVAKGKKITGTGKSFEFAFYGTGVTNVPIIIPDSINVIQINSVTYPIKTIISVFDTTLLDFSTPQTIAEADIDGTRCSLTVSVQNNMLTIACEQMIDIELFYGKDRYI
jgi:hypothetical protein